MIYLMTNTLKGRIGDLSVTDDKAEAKVILVGGSKMNLSEFPNLRGIFRCGVGRDNIPFAEAEKRGVAVGFPSDGTKDIIYTETANFACQRIFRLAYAEIGDVETWTKAERVLLNNKTLLVVGTGNIGGKVARNMAPFMNVETFDILNNRPEEFPEMLRRADVVTLHTPLTDSTRGLLNGETLALLRDGAGVVNTARGEVVDEDALYSEISRGRLRAAFDAYWHEPYRGKLTEFSDDRFLMSPHCASACGEFLDGTAADFRAFLKELD